MAESIAQELERRVSFRRRDEAGRVQTPMRMGALRHPGQMSRAASVAPRSPGPSGIRDGPGCRGNTGSAAISTTACEAKTYPGHGIKVWIFKGEIMEPRPVGPAIAAQSEPQEGGGAHGAPVTGKGAREMLQPKRPQSLAKAHKGRSSGEAKGPGPGPELRPPSA